MSEVVKRPDTEIELVSARREVTDDSAHSPPFFIGIYALRRRQGSFE